jgi:sigma-B regulation protein RsbU (phosphoserine phosphatase)
MAMTRSILRSSLNQAASPAQGIAAANHLICADSTINMPVTAFYGVIDPQNDQFIYVNAGHNPPLLYRNGEHQPIELTRTGMLLGFLEDALYEQSAVTIHSGDFVVLYTDGVSDATNVDQESFGTIRLKNAINNNRGGSAGQILSGIEKSVRDFIGSAAPYDDITLIVLRCL